MKKRSPIEYIGDFYYGATRFPSGLIKPRIALGHFDADEKGGLQRVYFKELLKQGFKRTVWQLVFPGQNAGLIKKIPIQQDGTNEYHIRFYEDGLIDCELEVDRFSANHWAGPHKHGTDILNELLEKSEIPIEIRNEIKKLFGERDYSEECIRNHCKTVPTT